MPTIADIKRTADERLHAGHFEDALRAYLQIVEAQPLNLDARLRAADALLALGEVQRAAVVYTRLAQYATHAGYPLRALVALKILGTLEPGLAWLLRSVGELYGRSSSRVGAGVRRSLPSDEEALPRSALPPAGRGSELALEAERIASDYAHKDALFPDKLMPIPLLSQLDIEELSQVFEACELLRVRAGAVIVEQGSVGRTMFILARGSVRVRRTHGDGQVRDLATLREGALFGELSLLSGAPRNAAVVALEDCDLLALSLQALSGADQARAQLAQVVSAFAHERLLAHVMTSSPLFAALAPAQRIDLMKRFVEVEASAGAQIVAQEQPSPGAYVVLRGEVVVEREQAGQGVELAKLGPGELFGEMSLLWGGGASASVRAREATTLLFLAKSYFDRLLEALPEVRPQLEQLAGRRSREIAASFPSPEPGDDGIEIEVML